MKWKGKEQMKQIENVEKMDKTVEVKEANIVYFSKHANCTKILYSA
jgi:hypothetical protein